jgi:translocation and assembly module TamB
VRIIGNEAQANRHWVVKTDISAELRGQNRLRAAGFNGLLSGNIQVHSETGDLTTADGRLTIAEGTYRAYGAEVPIRSGQVEFVGGSLDDPAITIVSRKTIEQKEVGFDVTGTLRTPIVTLVSSPEMDQSEILSWLLYGRASDDVQGAGTAILANTIRESLGNEEEESFVQRIFGKMGMSDLGIESDVAITRGVGLRKQLTPRMQIKYQLDIWEQTTRLILRYKLNDHWSVEGISGDMGGGDILYERER